MVTTVSPPADSPSQTATMTRSPPLAPLMTTPSSQRRTSANRPSSLLNRRASSYSNTRSLPPVSRPESTVSAAFPSSLQYTLVRDFAYPWSHPMHYGPQPEDQAATPASESRRLSDPTLTGWEDSRSQWSATPPWMADNNYSSRDHLPAMTFNDGGPPYSEDDDLQSPIVTSSRHKKHKSERGRSPGLAEPHKGIVIGAHGDRIEEYHPTGNDEIDGPGGEIETYTTASYRPKQRDSNFAKSLQRNKMRDGSFERVPGEDSDEEARYSKEYSFTIASPDEEMHGKAVALFDFESEHENELPLREGQIVLVSYRHGQGWLVAEDPRTGESGLVPEEFVRLLRHIEGGWSGLSSFEEGDIVSPTSNDPGSAVTPTPPSDGFEKQPAVQSSFSTHTRDFSPMPKSSRVEESSRSPDLDITPKVSQG